MHKNILLLGSVAVLLTACASQMTPQQLYNAGKPLEIGLYKAGSTQSQRDSATMDCRVEAAQRVPPNMQIKTTPTYTTPVTTQCNQIGYSTYCNSTGGQTYGGNTYSVDANTKLRTQVEARCLAQKGYSAPLVPACPKGVTSDQLQPLSGHSATRQGRLTASSCYIANEKVQVIGNL